MGGSSAERIRGLLAAALAPSVLDVADVSDGCGAKFEIVIVSESFEGKKLLERHRQVHEALGSEMDVIHALSLKAWTAAQYEAKREQVAQSGA